MNFGNFYTNDELHSDFSNTIISPYNPSVLEDYSKIEISNEERKYFIENIENIFETNSEINTIIGTYNINMSIPNLKIAFLNLVTCLESLLVSTNFELTYQISRGVAVLLSDNKEV